MLEHIHLDKASLARLIRRRKIVLAGNVKLKIYGRLNCTSGKRMKNENRIFFEHEREAIQLGYRPCGHCMKTEYHRWLQKNYHLL